MHKKEQKQDSKTPPPAGEVAAAGPASVEKPASVPDKPAASPLLPAVVSLPVPEVEQLKAEAAKAKDHWDRLLRTAAEFENFRKRVTRERQEAARYAGASLIQKLIPVLDNFDMALAAAQNSQPGALQSLQAGLAMIYQQFRNALTEAGLQEIDAQGKPFDHHWHEAVSAQPSGDVPDGHVVQQLRKGYKLHDRLLRPASVVVAKKPVAEQAATASPAEPPGRETKS